MTIGHLEGQVVCTIDGNSDESIVIVIICDHQRLIRIHITYSLESIAHWDGISIHIKADAYHPKHKHAEPYNPMMMYEHDYYNLMCVP